VVSIQKWTLVVERDIDGVHILQRRTRLTAREVLVARYEEESLPGSLVRFEKSKFVHGDLDDEVVWRTE
jgi:hypothetical protein